MKKLNLKFEISNWTFDVRRWLRNSILLPITDNRLFSTSSIQVLNTLLIFALCLCASVVKSDVHYVSKKGSDTFPYTTIETAARVIQDAVFAATDGDTVLVNDGTYRTGGAVAPGQALMNRVMITNSIILKSINGPKKTRIMGRKHLAVTDKDMRPGHTNNIIRCVYLDTNVQLIGFTIKNGGTFNWGWQGGYIYTNGNCYGGGIFGKKKCSIFNCIIKNNHADRTGGGVYIISDGIISNCTLKHNSTFESGSGIFCITNCIIANCIISNNKPSGLSGVVHCKNGIIRDCTFTRNKSNYSIISIENSIVTNCIISRNKPIRWANNAGIHCKKSHIINCDFIKNKDVVVEAFKTSVIENCTFIKNKVKWKKNYSETGIITTEVVQLRDGSIMTNCTFIKNH